MDKVILKFFAENLFFRTNEEVTKVKLPGLNRKVLKNLDKFTPLLINQYNNPLEVESEKD